MCQTNKKYSAMGLAYCETSRSQVIEVVSRELLVRGGCAESSAQTDLQNSRYVVRWCVPCSNCYGNGE